MLTRIKEKLNEAVMVLNKSLQVAIIVSFLRLWLHWPLMQVAFEQEINIQNMNVELIAQMFKNYRSNVLFHLEGKHVHSLSTDRILIKPCPSDGQSS